MAEAVKTMSVMSRDHSNIVVIEFSTQRIIVRTKKEVGGENEVVVASISNYGFTENPMIMAFNAKYLLDALSHIDRTELMFEMTGPLNPGVFKIKDDASFLHLIMPIRVQN